MFQDINYFSVALENIPTIIDKLKIEEKKNNKIAEVMMHNLKIDADPNLTDDEKKRLRKELPKDSLDANIINSMLNTSEFSFSNKAVDSVFKNPLIRLAGTAAKKAYEFELDTIKDVQKVVVEKVIKYEQSGSAVKRGIGKAAEFVAGFGLFF